MTASTAQLGAPSPLSGLVDEQRLGSAGGQVAIGVAGIVLAIVLVMGQVSLAITKGIGVHLHMAVANMSEGNQVMESVIERGAPTIAMEQALAQQAKTLGNTSDALVATNAELVEIRATKQELIKVVGGMQSSSESLAGNVGAVNDSTAKMTGLLAGLPDATSRTHTQLSKINTDTSAINTELEAIAGKMVKYGLPRAKGAPTG